MSDNKDRHGPLRDNVRLLGDALGITLREHGGELLFGQVEAIRRLSRDARAGRAAAAALAGRLDELDGPALLQVVRAFSQFLNLANIAEQHHRVRMRGRAGQPSPAAVSGPDVGTFAALGTALRDAGIAPPALAAALRSVRVELVLTAHPTEVTRRT
ncbi:MAG: phosphoenolpyruvate carboxylase, partial [Gammaproteobacteria bacterium]